MSVVQKQFNCFHQDGTVDLSVCRKVGFKNVQARKAWHGQFGFNTDNAGIAYLLSFPPAPGTSPPCSSVSGCGDPTCSCLWEPYFGTPPTNKYLDLSCVAHTEVVSIIPPSPTVSADLSRSVSVNRLTGCQTVTGCSDSYTDLGTFEGLQNALTGDTTVDPCTLGISEHLPPNGIFNIATMMSFVRAIASDFACSGTVDSIITGCEPNYTCTSTDIPSGNVIDKLVVSGTAGTADFFSYTVTGLPICELHISVSETQSFFQVKSWGYAGSDLAATSDFHVTCNLSNPYTAAQLYQDVLQLLHRIDMSNDEQYPWRTDGYISIAPLVTFDETIPTAPDVTCAVQTICTAIASCASGCPFTGQPIGDLLPAGYGPFFDWNHQTFRCCRSGGPNDPTSYIYAYGAWAHTVPVSPIPPYTFTTCPPAVCPSPPAPPDVVKIDHFTVSGGVISIFTNTPIPAFDPMGSTPVAVCGTFAIDGIYNLSGPLGIGPFQYTVINPQINDAPFQTGCEGGVVGVVNINTDATFYTVGDTTDLAMPPTATQWTENRARLHFPLNAGSMPPGAWLIGAGGGGWLYAQKWAEIKIHRPSYNFARPCGIDKWMLDESKVVCVEQSDGMNPPTLEIQADIGLATNDLVYVTGVKGPPSVQDGVFKITVVDPTHIKLTTDATMRKVLSATQSGLSVDIVMEKPWDALTDGQSVDFAGVPGLGAGLIANVSDSTHFSVSGVLSAPYSSGGFSFFSGSFAYQQAPDSIDFAPGDDGNGIVGKIRLTNVPGICGRLSVAAAVQQGLKVVITTGTHYLQNGDLVDFHGVGALGSALAVTVLSSTSFSVNSTVGSYTGGGTWTVHGAAGYQWNDDQSKGNFLYADFTSNNRDYQEADKMCDQYHNDCNECASASPGFACVEVEPSVWESDVRQFQFQQNGIDRRFTDFLVEELCLPFDPCNPQIMAVVPAGSPENFPQPSHVEHFPSTCIVDWKYDDVEAPKWQGFYVQTYADLLAQVQHKPCITCDCMECTQNFIPSGCPQVQDDGSCEQDTCAEECLTHTGTTFYPHFPLVEALQDVPPGAPTPPIGHIGFPTYAELSTTVVDPTWTRLMPPSGPGYGSGAGTGGVDPCLPVLHETPWTLAINQWLCICSDGRFKQQYIDNGQSVHCPPPSP